MVPRFYQFQKRKSSGVFITFAPLCNTNQYFMDSIKFGTDGWRAIIAQDFTTDNVKRVSFGTAEWILNQGAENPSVVIGHDCRFAGPLFVQAAASVFVSKGIRVYYADGFVSTPMISLGARHFNTTLGVIITASHNPPTYSGYKLKGNFGGPLLPENIAEVEALIPDFVPSVPDIRLSENPLCEKVDLEGLYLQRVRESFDLEAIKKSGFRFAYDAMYGAGRGVMPKIMPGIEMLHGGENPNFGGVAPEPILKNLDEFSHYIREAGNIRSGLATDGDADRIGLFDSRGEFVDSHHIILLLIHYLVKYKGFRGKVITAFSVTDKVKKLCEHYGLEQETVKIGFKYVAGYFLSEDVLLGGEESGGIAVKGHIPERDGIWMGLIIWEFMAKSGKSLEELIDEIYAIVGSFKYDRSDLHIQEELKKRVMAKCAAGGFSSFGGKTVTKLETTDGFKYHFPDGEWLMIRASGTEPVLRVYAEAADKESVAVFLNESVREILAS